MTSKLTIEPIKRTTLTAKEVSVYLGLSIDSIYSLSREKTIPHIKVGNRLLYRKDSIDKWLNDMEQQ